MGQQPHAAGPEEQQRADEPEEQGRAVERHHLLAVDVEREHQDRQVAARASHGAQPFAVTPDVAAAADLLGRGTLHRADLGESLEERQAEEQEHREREQPGRESNLRGGDAREHAQGVEPGEQEDVDHGDLLEIQGVRRRQDDVDGQQLDEAGRQRVQADREGDAEQDRDEGHAEGGAQRSGGKRAMALGRMPAVRLEIEEVVEDVGARRGAAERREGGGRLRHGLGGEQLVVEHHRHEHEQVLDPLVYPERPHERERLCGSGGLGDLGRGHRRRLTRGRFRHVASRRAGSSTPVPGRSVRRPRSPSTAAPVARPDPSAVPVETIDGNVR